MWVARERRFEKGHQPALRVAPVAHILAANLPVAQQVVLAFVRDEHKGKVAWRVARHARELVNPAANATEAVKGGAREVHREVRVETLFIVSYYGACGLEELPANSLLTPGRFL